MFGLQSGCRCLLHLADLKAILPCNEQVWESPNMHRIAVKSGMSYDLVTQNDHSLREDTAAGVDDRRGYAYRSLTSIRSSYALGSVRGPLHGETNPFQH